jgi:hypothetical protein
MHYPYPPVPGSKKWESPNTGPILQIHGKNLIILETQRANNPINSSIWKGSLKIMNKKHIQIFSTSFE